MRGPPPAARWPWPPAAPGRRARRRSSAEGTTRRSAPRAGRRARRRRSRVRPGHRPRRVASALPAAARSPHPPCARPPRASARAARARRSPPPPAPGRVASTRRSPPAVARSAGPWAAGTGRTGSRRCLAGPRAPWSPGGARGPGRAPRRRRSRSRGPGAWTRHGPPAPLPHRGACPRARRAPVGRRASPLSTEAPAMALRMPNATTAAGRSDAAKERISPAWPASCDAAVAATRAPPRSSRGRSWLSRTAIPAARARVASSPAGHSSTTGRRRPRAASTSSCSAPPHRPE